MKTRSLLLSLLLIINFYGKAQFVTIPDAHFVNWLNINVPTAMLGNQLDTSSLLVKNMTTMYIASDSIQDFEGMQYFTGLQNLNCSNNQITYIPQLPDSLMTFSCSGNYLDSLPLLPIYLKELYCGINHMQNLPALPDSLTILDCNSNSLTTLPTLPLGLISMTCSGNPLTGLPALPNSLTFLNCNMNTLTVLPTLPNSLTDLNCLGNQLSTLPTLPLSLVMLNCEQNMLTSLPALPGSLVNLTCQFNLLTSLPTLPASLQNLNCSHNQLSSLPVLPSSLLELRCYYNQLPVLPTLPSSLTILDCNSNYLPTLPSLPASLYSLNCSANQITVLPVLSLSTSLSYLDCSHNLLPGIPTLPTFLYSMDCSYNPLLSLPVLNTSLSMLRCNNDGLDSLPSLPPSLNQLECFSNTLDSLPILPASLYVLNCQSNQLVALPALPSSMGMLACDANQIVSLPVLPNSLLTLSCNNNLINCFAVFPLSLTSMSIGGNPFTCLPNYLPVMDSLTLMIPLCVDGDFVNNPHACAGAEGVLGFTYFDLNSNCTKDSLDLNYINVPMKIYDGSGSLLAQIYTASNGVYNFPQPLGTFTVAVDSTNLPFVPACPAPGYDSTVTVTAAYPLVADVNFDFVCKPGFDIGIRSIMNCGLVFPGEQYTLKINAGDMSQFYNMHCASGVSGLVKITVNGPVTYVSPAAGALAPIVGGSTYIYSIADFGTVDVNTAFGLILKVDTLAVAGNDICVHVEVTPSGGDNDPSNNQLDLCSSVVNSHDPNLKEVYPVDVAPTYSDWFTYTIHFQNTGSAPAINIHVEDTLDSNLDLNTFDLLSYSHANTTILNGNILTCRFPSIWLPDSATDAAGSQGYLQYRIKMKPGLGIGTKIYNTAFIYFDYNSAIVTNTTVNELVEPMPMSVSDEAKNTSLSVYPNPASDVLKVEYSLQSKEAMLEVYDVTGRMLKQEKVTSTSQIINITDLSVGVYILKVKDGKNTSVQRFVKQ